MTGLLQFEDRVQHWRLAKLWETQTLATINLSKIFIFPQMPWLKIPWALVYIANLTLNTPAYSVACALCFSSPRSILIIPLFKAPFQTVSKHSHLLLVGNTMSRTLFKPAWTAQFKGTADGEVWPGRRSRAWVGRACGMGCFIHSAAQSPGTVLCHTNSFTWHKNNSLGTQLLVFQRLQSRLSGTTADRLTVGNEITHTKFVINF